MENPKDYSLESVKTFIEDFKAKRASQSMEVYGMLYKTALRDLDKAIKEDCYPNMIKIHQNSVDNIEKEINSELVRIREYDKKLEELETELREQYNFDYKVEDIDISSVSFDTPKIDDVEQEQIALSRETLDRDKSMGYLDDESLNESLLSDEDILKMNPPTNEDYEMYLDNLVNSKYLFSPRMQLLQKCKETDLIHIELLKTKIYCLKTYYHAYNALNRQDKVANILARIDVFTKIIEVLEKKEGKVQSKIGTEGKAIKAALKQKIAYYSDKAGYGR